MADTQKTVDVAIIGAGLAGLTAALCLTRHGLKVALLDRYAPEAMTLPAFDGRTTALNTASVALYRQLGIWPQLAPHAGQIDHIRITDNHAPEIIDFIGKEALLDAEMQVESASDLPPDLPPDLPMGYIVENRHFRQVLLKAALAEPAIAFLPPASLTSVTVDSGHAQITYQQQDGKQGFCSARLVIGADGKASRVRSLLSLPMRQVDYGQSAITFPVAHSVPHGNVAAEIFTPAGPLATLPMHGVQGHNDGHVSSIVWTRETPSAKALMALAEPLFIARFMEACGDWLADVTLAGARSCYPLSLTVADEYSAPRCCLVGDAAHGIHPIAGQGLNLGLQDVACLSQLLEQAQALGLDIGGQGLLENYQQQRRSQNRGMVLATHGLNQLFRNQNPLVASSRRMGLAAVQRASKLKHAFIRRAAGV